MSTNLTTAFVVLFLELGIKAPWEDEGEEPKALLVVGGGSNTGRFAIQLVRMAGADQIVAVGGKEEDLKARGATYILDRHQDAANVLQKVKETTGDGLTLALDCMNEPDGLGLGPDALYSKKKGSWPD